LYQTGSVIVSNENGYYDETDLHYSADYDIPEPQDLGCPRRKNKTCQTMNSVGHFYLKKYEKSEILKKLSTS